jgi:hypothetical protein
MKRNVLLFVFLSASAFSFAQDGGKNWKPSLGLAFTAVPATTISGVDTSYANKLSIAPSFTLRNRAGWGITYSPRIISDGGSSGIYMHALTAGLEQYDKEKVDYTFDYSHYFFNKNTSVPYTPLNNEIYAALTVKQLWLRPTFSAGIGFGKDTLAGASSSASDVGIAAGVSHAFSWEDNGTDFSLVPRVMLNAGTNESFSLLNFSKYIGHSSHFARYVKSGPGSTRGRRGGGSGSGGTTTSTPTAVSFSLSNFEIGVESEIEHGNFAVRPSASLYIPSGTAAGTGVFGYWEIMLGYRF